MVSIPTIRSTTSSCQPPIIKQLGSVTVRPHVNSRVKTLSGAKPCVFSGKVASVVAEGGSLFPQFRGSLTRSDKNAQDCSESSRVLQNAKNLTGLEDFWKIRFSKCARDCSESSICSSKNQVRELDLHFNEFALHFKIAKTEGSGHFWKMKQAKSARDSSQFKIAKT